MKHAFGFIVIAILAVGNAHQCVTDQRLDALEKPKPPAPVMPFNAVQEARIRALARDEAQKAEKARNEALFGGKVPKLGKLPAVRGGGK